MPKRLNWFKIWTCSWLWLRPPRTRRLTIKERIILHPALIRMKLFFFLEVSVAFLFRSTRLATITRLLPYSGAFLEIVESIYCNVYSNSLPKLFPGKFKSIVIAGRSWSDGSDPSAADSSQVVGGSLATEGVRTALAQLLNLHGMHVNGLEPLVGHPPTQNSGGKWYWKRTVGKFFYPLHRWYFWLLYPLSFIFVVFAPSTPYSVWRLPLFNEINGFIWSVELERDTQFRLWATRSLIVLFHGLEWYRIMRVHGCLPVNL